MLGRSFSQGIVINDAISSLSAMPIVADFLVVRFWLLDIRSLAMSIVVGATATAGLLIYFAVMLLKRVT